MTQTQTRTESDIEAVAERLVQVLNDGCLTLMLSVGHRTGLFRVLADGRPRTSVELAAEAGLQERYVREWLGAMTTGRVVTCTPVEVPAYTLDEAHAALLTDAGPMNLAAIAQFVAVLGAVEDDVVRCFHEGGGVPYDAYPRFHEVMAEDSAQTVLAALESMILPLVPGLTDRLRAGIDVLDIGCGTGQALLQLAQAYPASRFTGLDLSESAIARASAHADGLANLRYLVGDATDLTAYVEPGSAELVTTFDAIHDQAHPATVLAGIHRSLRPGGVYLAQDINTSGSHHGDLDHPLGPFLYTVSCLHCTTVSLAQGGDGLGAAWGRPTAERMLGEAGFTDVVVHQLPHDEQNLYYVCAP